MGIDMINFLIESVQGPCKENQNCLIKTKLVDYITGLLNLFNK
jgi:hypothetical protein